MWCERDASGRNDLSIPYPTACDYHLDDTLTVRVLTAMADVQRVPRPQRCPRCSSPRIRRSGRPRGYRRWICRECKRTFGETYGTPAYRRRKGPAGPPCPHCQVPDTYGNGWDRTGPRWRCRACDKTFGPATGTTLACLQVPVREVARSLALLMQHASLRAAEAATGHKGETLSRWLRAVADDPAARTTVRAALTDELRFTAAECDAFETFIQRCVQRLDRGRVNHPGWMHAEDARV